MSSSTIILKQKGLKATSQRLSILDILRSTQQPLSALKIFEKLSGSVDLATVYRTLHSLAEKKVIFSDIINSEARYYVATKHHHHIECERCKRVKCVPCNYPIPKIKDFSKITHQAAFTGICSKCS